MGKSLKEKNEYEVTSNCFESFEKGILKVIRIVA